MQSTALLIAAAILLAFIGLAHSYLGERFVFGRLLALPDLPLLRNDRAYTQKVLRYAWHLSSLAWWGFAAALVVLAFLAERPPALGAVLAVTFLLSGALILATAGRRHPAWSLFLLAGAATWFATR